MATRVQVLGRMIDNFTMVQKLAGVQQAYELVIPGGVLSNSNSLELLMQISTRSIGDILTPKRTELRLDDTYVAPEGNVRASWSYVGLEGGKEVIYQAIYGAASSNGAEYSDGTFPRPDRQYDLFKIRGGAPTGSKSSEEVPLVPSPVSNGDVNSNQSVGIADRPAYAWFYLFGFNVVHIIQDPADRTQDKQVVIGQDSAAGECPPGIKPDNPWSLYKDSLFVCGKTSGFSDQFYICEYSTITTNLNGTAVMLNYTDPNFYPHGWVHAIHATEDWLYVLLTGVGGVSHIVKLTKDGNYTVAADYNLGVGNYVQAFYVVNEDLIYFVYRTANNSPTAIYAWKGGDEGEAVLIDDSVGSDANGNSVGWIIWVNNVFPSYVTMGYQVVNGQAFIYLGTDGANGNGTSIFKIGIGSRQPTCP